MIEKVKQIPNLLESIRGKISRLRSDVRRQVDVFEFQEKMLDFVEKIKKNHPDYKRYRCYHQLINSGGTAGAIVEGEFDGLFKNEVGDTPDNSEILDSDGLVEGDFEGEDSVVAFLEGLLKERS